MDENPEKARMAIKMKNNREAGTTPALSSTNCMDVEGIDP